MTNSSLPPEKSTRITILFLFSDARVKKHLSAAVTLEPSLACTLKKYIMVAEDPGAEPVEQISKDIAQYVEAQHCPYEMIEDRGEAIHKAIMEAEGKTILLITGKGNETRQKYGTEYLDCPSDVEYTKKYLAEYDAVH